MNHIELFAGCGGLSLGLETAGFELLVANELSPMAAETFAYNHLNADLEGQKNIDKVFWVSSVHPRTAIKSRLRENPYDATGLNKRHYSDLLELKPDNEELKRSLLVGSIIDINNIIDPSGDMGKENRWLLEQLKSGLGSGEVDLISGGPPCQSFSLAGMRDHTHHRNQLPGEFARFVGMVRPRIALLENVSGILRPFNIEGTKFYAWFEVAKAFLREGYVPLCLHVNAKYVGTAQNRPRFIMIALRHDTFKLLENNSEPSDSVIEALRQSEALLPTMAAIKEVEKEPLDEKEKIEKIKKIEDQIQKINYYDIDQNDSFFRNTILSPLVSFKDPNNSKKLLISVKQAIDDLHPEGGSESDYVNRINNEYIRVHSHPLNKFSNHELRSNKNLVRARFRIYQIISKLTPQQAKEISNYLKTSGETGISESTILGIKKHWILDLNGTQVKKPSKDEVAKLLAGLYTKKQTQKALLADDPAPAALSIPDDACHYHESPSMQRTLTVREMTRIQSFPDWYEFKSKITTGGQMRKFEVPQYTQVGNAVPPLLGVALGEICKSILKKAYD